MPTTNANVDEKAGVIFGVCVAKVGEARGHVYTVPGTKLELPVMADGVTLDQFIACAGEYQNGVKVRDTAAHEDGSIGNTVGTLKDFRRDGDKAVADLYVLESFAGREQLFEMAREMPDTFGLSAVTCGLPEIKDGVALARCNEILSVDIVPNGALTPDGLFARPAAKMTTRLFTEFFYTAPTHRTIQQPTTETNMPLKSDSVTQTSATPAPAAAVVPPPATATPAATAPAAPAKSNVVTFGAVEVDKFTAKLNQQMKFAMTTNDLREQCSAVITVAYGLRSMCDCLVSLVYGLSDSSRQVPADMSAAAAVVEPDGDEPAVVVDADMDGMAAKMADRFKFSRPGVAAPAAAAAAPVLDVAAITKQATDAATKAAAGVISKFSVLPAALPAAAVSDTTGDVLTVYQKLAGASKMKFFNNHEKEIRAAYVRH